MSRTLCQASNRQTGGHLETDFVKLRQAELWEDALELLAKDESVDVGTCIVAVGP